MSIQVLRALSAAAVSAIVVMAMAIGANFAGMANWEIAAFGVLGGMGAAVYVLFFA